MDLSTFTESWGGGSLAWLGSKHATNDAETVTLDVSKFASFGDTIPSGTPLKKGEGNLYEPVTAAGDTLAGFLLTDQPNRATKQVAPMLWHGRIRPDRLPSGAFDVRTLTTIPGVFVLAPTEGA